MLSRAANAAAESSVRRIDVGRVLDERSMRATSRREFIGRISLAAAAMAAAPPLFAGKAGGSSARVVVIGAGLAGLTCAYRLKQAGVNATIYEANSRLGGRCWTRRGDFAEGQIAEHGGELIDQSHTAVRQLAQELRLPLDNLLAAEPNGMEPFYRFGGADYSYQEAVDDLKAIWQKIHRDLTEAGYPTTYSRYTIRGAQLDRMSITDWINESVPGGIQSRLGQLLDVAYTIEYGAECAQQSALSLLYLLGYNSPGQFSLFGASNEKYHVRGGNDQIVTALAEQLGQQIVTGSALVAARRNAAGTYTVTFQSGRRVFDVTADKVVFALPFSIMNNSVDLTRAGFGDLKNLAIRELAMGANSKLNVQFGSRHWNALGNNGDTYADTGYQATWEVTRGQAGTAGILVNYTGGDKAETFGSGTPASQAAQFLKQIEPVLPGLGAAWNGRATVDCWSRDPFTRGSYSFWQVGQYTRFAGIEGAQDGNAHFCGEHTSIDAQGYLEGAVETGQRAASEVVADLNA
jgi:monoamine oxidase